MGIDKQESCGEDGQGWQQGRRFEGVHSLSSMGLPYVRSPPVPTTFPFAWLPARHMEGHLGESSSSNLFPQRISIEIAPGFTYELLAMIKVKVKVKVKCPSFMPPREDVVVSLQ